MEELSRIGAVHNAVKQYIEGKDYSVPFIIGATNLDKEDAICYVIDTVMNVNRVGLFVAISSLCNLQQDVDKAVSQSSSYLVKKVYASETLDHTDFVLLSQQLKSPIPVFVVFSPAQTEKHRAQMAATAFVY